MGNNRFDFSINGKQFKYCKMDTPPVWGLGHRASNPVSVKNLTAIET
jgi:hypothetical protein